MDDQQHLLLCRRTTIGVDLEGVVYSDIFGALEKQIKAAKIFKKVIRNRTTILENSSMRIPSDASYAYYLLYTIWINIYIYIYILTMTISNEHIYYQPSCILKFFVGSGIRSKDLEGLI